VLLGSLTAFGPLSVDMYLPALPHIASELDAGPASIQLTLTAVLAGLALGQLVAGPVSDALGRKRPLLVGVAAYAAASLLCAVAPSAPALVGLRFVQGLAGSAGVVIARAIVRDLYAGDAAARVFSILVLVMGAAPVLAPTLGAQVLRVAGWRAIFVVLAVIGILLVLAVAGGLDETHAAERRAIGGVVETLGTMRRLLADRSFLGYALTGGFGFGALFAYISGSSFVLERVYGLSPQRFGLFFAINAAGFVVMAQVNARIVGRAGARRLLAIGLASGAAGALALLVVAATHAGGLAGILPCLFVVQTSLGLVLPNSTALALTDHPAVAGSASALLGVLQYAVGAVAAPIVGVAGTSSALPMSVVIALLASSAVVAWLALVRGTAAT
jgi:DHA1 family bicyclomycin/chloramphenicol resistance-like MFS transporter